MPKVPWALCYILRLGSVSVSADLQMKKPRALWVRRPPVLAIEARVLLWQQVLGHLRPTPTKPTGDSPIFSLVSNLELIATWSLPRPMIWKSQGKGHVTTLT